MPTVTPLHLYDLNGSLADQMGGPTLVANGGTLTDTHYVFDANQGLQLTGGLTDTANYSIVLVGSYSSGSFFKKVIDFQARTIDPGLYLAGTNFQLYPGALGTGTVTANTEFHLTLTRDAATGITSIYLNGVLDQTYSGSHSSVAVSANNILTFFQDDQGSEAGAGSVDYIAIYSRPLSAVEVAELLNPPNVVPDVSANLATLTFNEGQTAVNSGTWANAVTLSASVGTVTQFAGGTWSWSLAVTDGPAQTQTVSITATGSDSTSVATTFQLNVNNLPPVLTSNHVTVTVAEGRTATNDGTFFDVGSDVVTLTASIGTVTADDAGDWTWSFAALDGQDLPQLVTISATDDDGATAATIFELTVSNEAPSITSLTSSNPTEKLISENGLVTIAGTFADDGLLDTHSVTVSWGDGSVESLTSVDQLRDSFTGMHTYAHGGVFTITVTVRDNDGGQATMTATAVVAGVGQVGDTLYVVGSEGKDSIHIDLFRGSAAAPVLRVQTNFGLGIADRSSPGPSVAYYDPASIQRIVILACGGNDQIMIGNDVLIDVTVLGGDTSNLWDFYSGVRSVHVAMSSNQRPGFCRTLTKQRISLHFDALTCILQLHTITLRKPH